MAKKDRRKNWTRVLALVLAILMILSVAATFIAYMIRAY